MVIEPPLVAYLASTRSSYEATHSPLWWVQYVLELALVGVTPVMGIAYGRHAAAEDRVERAVRRRLEVQAAKAIGLLSTAMPPAIAQALIERRPAHELMETGDHVAIAFIRLADYPRHAATMEPIALLTWLDTVYATFDRLIDVYADTGEATSLVDWSAGWERWGGLHCSW